MNESLLVKRRSGEWEELDRLCSKLESSPNQMTESNVNEFVRKYRRASTDLSIIRSRSQNEGITQNLNRIVARAYALLHSRPTPGLSGLIRHAVTLAAVTYRRNRVFVWSSAALFLGAWLAAFAFCKFDPLLIDSMSLGQGALFEQWKEGQHDARTAGESTSMTLFYAGNNPRVSIIAGALGAATMGIMSVYLLVTNGLLLGALSFEMDSVGKLPFLLSSIAPHGVPEISGIIFSGAAGLRFGWAILNPGLHTRGESLRRSGRDGLALMLIGVVLCFIAAPIEGFFSFNPAIPQVVKAIVAAVSLGFWVAFWKFYARGAEDEREFKPVHEQSERS